MMALLEEGIKEIIFIAKFLYKWQVLASIGKMSDIRGGGKHNVGLPSSIPGLRV